MKILFLTKGDRNVPSSNFRVWVLSDFLKEKYGWECDFFYKIGYPFFSISRDRFKAHKALIRALKNNSYNLIFVHKALFPVDYVILLWILKMIHRIPLVYDIDDPQWGHSRFQDFMLSHIADIIFASSIPFLERYGKINKNTIFIPTVVDHRKYASIRAQYQKKDSYIVGWVGSGEGHFRHGNFHLVKPALEILGKRGYDITFRVIGTRGYTPLEEYIQSPHYKAEPIDLVPFEDVPKGIAKFDVGVAPVVDIEWFQINATAKGIEYMAVGVPTVASSVGAYKHIIKDGENGFLARNTEEWVEKLALLLDSRDLREKVGVAGLKTVEEEYSYDVLIPRIKREFETL